MTKIAYNSRPYHDVTNVLPNGEKGEKAFERNMREYLEQYKAQFGSLPRKAHGSEPEGAIADIVRNLKHIVQGYEAVRKGNFQDAPRNISLGQYIAERYGIATDKNGTLEGIFRFLGLPDKQNMTLSSLYESSSMQFATIPEYNESFRWLISETILDPIRVMLLQRGIWRQLIQSAETVANDTVIAPIFKRPSGRWQQLREGAQIKSGKLEFTETRVQLKTIATGIEITDQIARNIAVNILQEYIGMMASIELDDRLTYDCVHTILNGNDPAGSDAASIIGVQSAGVLDYDDDWLPLVIKMITLGMRPEVVLGDATMITEVMSLPEFKGFDGTAKLANVTLDRGIRALMPSEYSVVPTGAMPAAGGGGGKLLFIDPMATVSHYTSKPLSMETARIVEKLSSFHQINMTTGFLKKRVDSSFVLDTSITYALNPFPAEYNSELLQREGYDK